MIIQASDGVDICEVKDLKNNISQSEYRKYIADRRKNGVTIHFINLYNKKNVGDYNCSPLLYFGELFDEYTCHIHNLLYIDYSKILPNDIVIIGGGGLLNHSKEWNLSYEKLKEIGCKMVLWGTGFNNHNGEEKYETNLNIFDLYGVRDCKDEIRWVPCPSCMIPEINYSYSNLRDIGVIEHKQFPINEFKYEKLNNSMDLRKIINFIGTSNIIITNSYHAAYWGILMNKKVILYKVWSDKFDYMKWKLPNYSGDLDKDIENCIIYSDALNECVEANKKFAKDVKQLIEEIK